MKESVKEFWGATCPQCGDDTRLEITFEGWTTLRGGDPDYLDADGTEYFNDSSNCLCRSCDWFGTFAEAKGLPAPAVKASHPIIIDALNECERFIAGFERDDLQDGLPETLLQQIEQARAALLALSAESTPTPIAEQASAPVAREGRTPERLLRMIHYLARRKARAAGDATDRRVADLELKLARLYLDSPIEEPFDCTECDHTWHPAR